MDRTTSVIGLALGFALISVWCVSCDAAAVTNTANEMTDGTISSSGNELLPCAIKGTIVLTGETYVYDECTSCTCNNATIVCSLQGCPAVIECTNDTEPITKENECCQSCPENSTLIDNYADVADLEVCIIQGKPVSVGETVQITDCQSCVCQAEFDVKCETRGCFALNCHHSTWIDIDGQCCDVCPYYLPVWQVEPSDLPPISAGKPNNVVFNLVIHSIGGYAIRGDGLYKVSAWVADSDGNRIGFIDQVLSDKQADTEMNRPEFFGGFDFTIDGIQFALNASDATCSQMEYLCVEFAKGDNPTMRDPRLPFTVEGVIGARNETSAPNNLVGCSPFPACKDPGARHRLSFSVAKKSGQIAPVPTTLQSWSDVFNNVGGAFNSKTGVFTSYETGSYFFTYQIVETSNALSPQVTLMKNDEVLLTGSSNSNSLIVHLEVGDTVWMQLQGELVGSPERYSTFSGFLIQ